MKEQGFLTKIIALELQMIKEIRLEAKKEVFDDIEKFNDGLSKRLYHSLRYKELKERHLSTSQKKSDIITDKHNSQICNHVFNDIDICEECGIHKDDIMD